MPYLSSQGQKWDLHLGRLTAAAACFLIGSFLAPGCSNKKASGDACNPDAVDTNAECGDTLVCEPVQGGGGKCYAAVLLEGTVFDLQTNAPISDARVVALDINGAAVSSVAVSGA